MSDLPWTYVTRLLSSAANAAEQRGLAVAMTVADRCGAPVGALTMPGVPQLSARLAGAKAYTAASFARDSSDVEKLEDLEPSLLSAADRLGDQPIVTAPGGVAILDGDRIVGAIGVAGGSGEQNTDVAKAALAAHPVGAWMGRT